MSTYNHPFRTQRGASHYINDTGPFSRWFLEETEFIHMMWIKSDFLLLKTTNPFSAASHGSLDIPLPIWMIILDTYRRNTTRRSRENAALVHNMYAGIWSETIKDHHQSQLEDTSARTRTVLIITFYKSSVAYEKFFVTAAFTWAIYNPNVPLNY